MSPPRAAVVRFSLFVGLCLLTLTCTAAAQSHRSSQTQSSYERAVFVPTAVLSPAGTVSRSFGNVTYSFDSCQSVTFGELCWFTSGSYITIAYTYGPWSGYVALGFSDTGGMLGSTAVIGWAGSAPYIDNYDLNSYSGNSPGAVTLLLVNASVSSNTSSGLTTLLFTRPLTLSAASNKPFANISPSAANVMIQSHGPLPSSPNSVQQHSMPPGVDSVTFTAPSAPNAFSSSAAAAPTAASATSSATVLSSTAGSSSSLPVTRVIGGVSIIFDFCELLTYGELCWLTVGGVITIAYSYQWSGWLGLGFSSDGSMLGSSAVIGWSSGSSTFIDEYFLGSQNDGGNSPGATALSLINRSVTVDAAGLTTLLFSRPLTLSASSAAFPFGTISSLGSNTLIEAHGPLPSTPNSVSYHGANSRAADSVSFASGAVVEVTSDIDRWRSAHAALMTLSFGLLFPLGIISARFLKGFGPIWFGLHRAFVLLALALLIAGFAIAINKLNTGLHLTHRGIGIFVCSAMLFQLLNAMLRPHPPAKGEQPTTLRRAWEVLHHWNARIAYVLAIVNIGIGFNILQPATRYVVVFWVLWGCVVLTAVMLQLWSTCFSGQHSGAAGVVMADKQAVADKSAAVDVGPRVDLETA